MVIPVLVFAALTSLSGPPETCTYRTYAWSVTRKAAVDHRNVVKPYARLAPDERDPLDPRCTVCREDQQVVTIEGLPPVTVCRHWANDVSRALTEVRDAGSFRVVRLEGYRPGLTRGPVKAGRRTEWSNHAFGTAIDVNAHHNGLYGGCDVPAPPTAASDLAGCRLGMGGPWDPVARPETTVVAGGVPHRAFTRFWKWGGELSSGLKDLMHFSLDGR